MVANARYENDVPDKIHMQSSIYGTLKIKPFLKYFPLNQRKALVYKKVLGIASYGLALYIGQTKQVKDNLPAV